MATKLPKDVVKFFQKTGAQGGKARAERHSKEQLSEWGRKGGRPKNNPNAPNAAAAAKPKPAPVAEAPAPAVLKKPVVIKAEPAKPVARVKAAIERTRSSCCAKSLQESVRMICAVIRGIERATT